MSYLPTVLVLFSTIFVCTSLKAKSNTEKESKIDCKNAETTFDVNHCTGLELESAERELQKYYKKSLEHRKGEPELVVAIKNSQKQWEKYLEAHCDSVFTQWKGGTVRHAMYLSCRTELTQQRTFILWNDFLTFMDSTPPVLPKPKK